jgi:hypothetical protein
LFIEIIVVVDDDVDLMSTSILMGCTAPTFLNATTATIAIELRAQMLLFLLLLPQSLRDPFHPCVRRRLALGNEKARLRRLFIPKGKKLSVQHERPDKPDQIKQTQTPGLIQTP